MHTREKPLKAMNKTFIFVVFVFVSVVLQIYFSFFLLNFFDS